MKIYVSSFGLQSAAGGICVCCAVFHNDIPEKTIANIKEYIRREAVDGVDKLSDVLDLDDKKEYYLVYKILTLDSLTWHSNSLAVSKIVDYLVSRTIVELSIGHPEVIICDTYTINGFFINNVKRDLESNNAIFCKMLSAYYFKWWLIHYYHHFNPLYELDKNLGRFTPKHLHNMFVLGLDYRIYKKSAAIPTARQWLRLARQDDLWATALPYLLKPPSWWANLYPNIPFIFFYSLREKKELISLLKPSIPTTDIRNDIVTSHLLDDLPLTDSEKLCLYKRINKEKNDTLKTDYTYQGIDLSPLLTHDSYRNSKPQLYNPKL